MKSTSEELPGVSGLLPSAGAALRERFAAAGVDPAFVRRHHVGEDNLRAHLTPDREALFSDDAAFVLFRAFFCGVPVGESLLRAQLRGGLFEQVRDCGLLWERGGAWAGAFHLRFAAGLLLFSDRLGAHPDAVMGAGETTAVLYRAAIPARRQGRALDLGCGAGTLALLLAPHCGDVTGADINPRAVALSRFNAGVNGIGNAAFVCGDLYEPLAGRFDWIVSQPPYYPRSAGQAGLTFLHGGERGDEIPRRVLAGLDHHLSPTGRAFVFTSWPEDREAFDTARYRIVEFWADRREIAGTRQSLLALEPAPGGGWLTGIEMPAETWGNLSGAQVNRAFQVEALLRGPVEALLAGPYRMGAGVRIGREAAQFLVHGPGAGCVPVTQLAAVALQNLADGGSPRGADPDLLATFLRRGWLDLAAA